MGRTSATRLDSGAVPELEGPEPQASCEVMAERLREDRLREKFDRGAMQPFLDRLNGPHPRIAPRLSLLEAKASFRSSVMAAVKTDVMMSPLSCFEARWHGQHE